MLLVSLSTSRLSLSRFTTIVVHTFLLAPTFFLPLSFPQNPKLTIFSFFFFEKEKRKPGSIIPCSFVSGGTTSIAMARPRLFSCFRGRSSAASTTSPTSSRGGSHAEGEENVTAGWSQEQWRGGPVVVELFSSQGCAASLEAELLLSRLGRGDFELEVPLIPMAFHVDIWDYKGWKDPYGSAQWTVRHKAYVEALNLDALVTPQIVVHGHAPCAADDEKAILSCIDSAPRYPMLAFQVRTFKTTLFLNIIHENVKKWKIACMHVSVWSQETQNI